MIHVFIINHFAGSKYWAKDLRKHLAEKKDLRYFVFNTVQPGFEGNLVKKMQKYFEDEKLRFYCCGGSGTMRNMLNGMENLSDVEVAFFPCGLTNDFLKCFAGGEDAFRDIDQLIDGKVVSVDYIRTNHGIGLNTVSLGLDAKYASYMESMRLYSFFGSQVPYVLSLICATLSTDYREYCVTVDGVDASGQYSEMIIGNGGVLGGNLFIGEKPPDVTDGIASYMIVRKIKGVSAIRFLMDLMKKKYTRLKKRARIGDCRRFTVQSTDGRPIQMNLDGELIDGWDRWEIEIVQKGLQFVVPQNMEL